MRLKENNRTYEGHEAELYNKGLNHYVVGVPYRISIDNVVLENTCEYNSHLLLELGSSHGYSIHFDLCKFEVFCLYLWDTG